MIWQYDKDDMPSDHTQCRASGVADGRGEDDTCGYGESDFYVHFMGYGRGQGIAAHVATDGDATGLADGSGDKGGCG